MFPTEALETTGFQPGILERGAQERCQHGDSQGPLSKFPAPLVMRLLLLGCVDELEEFDVCEFGAELLTVS